MFQQQPLSLSQASLQNQLKIKRQFSVEELFCSDLSIKCQLCNKSFNKKSHLYRHQREKHQEGENRQYICTHQGCDKKFKRGSHLKRHMISHTNQKNFKCLKCIMSFGYKHHLDRHIKLVHDRELFKCSECTMEFMKKKSLAKHVKDQHEKNKKGCEDGNNDQNGEKQKKVKKIAKKTKSKRIISRSKKTVKNINEQSMIKKQYNEENQVFQCLKLGENEGQWGNKAQKIKKQEDIFYSQNEEQQKNNANKNIDDKILYRCSQNQCFSAFYNQYALKKHLKSVHKIENGQQ